MTYPGVDPALDPDRAAVEERRKEREEEFTTYRATQDIPWGSVPAFFAGEVVPKSTVENLGWLGLGLVERIDSQPDQPATPAPVDAAPAAPSVRATSKKTEG